VEKRNDDLRERLLARLPKPANYAAYQEEVAVELAKRQRWLSFTKWSARAIGIYVFGFFLVTYFHGDAWLNTAHGRVWAFVSTILIVIGAMQLLKFFIMLSRVEILKEVKQVQLQVLELQANLERNEH